MSHQRAWPLQATTWVTLALGSVYAVMLIPGVRPTPGYQPAIYWWPNMTVDALVILVLAVRTEVDRTDRTAWMMMVGSASQQVRVSAYRIAREAMVNARKHAQSTSVDVTIDATGAGVEVHVVDDGRGTSRAASTRSTRRHSGVAAMRDRALASGGWWRSEPGRNGIGTECRSSSRWPTPPPATPRAVGAKCTGVPPEDGRSL